jgi:hypothetical protein
MQPGRKPAKVCCVKQLVCLHKKIFTGICSLPQRFGVLERRPPLFAGFSNSRDMEKSLRVSFAFPPVEGWFHPSAAGLRRAGLCGAQFSRPSFAFFPRSEHVPLLLVRLDLARNLA